MGMHACSVTQLCLTLCDLMDCSLPGSSIPGIFQARILESAAIFYFLSAIILYIIVCICQSQSPNLSLPSFSLVTLSLFSIAVTLFGKEILCTIFGFHIQVIIVFSDFTQYDHLWVHPCCCKWHYFILFYG